MLSNKRVCKDIIEILEESELTDNEVIDVFNNLLLDESKQTNIKALLSAADMTLDSGRAPDGFKNVTIGKIKKRLVVSFWLKSKRRINKTI